MSQAVSAPMRSRIGGELAELEASHGVRILFAVESGSRAWGFPSPDSDYDVRFVYAHPPDDYVRLRPPRDVIELPIDSELDIGGWDIRKALGLLLKGNSVLLEWLQSPVRYRWDAPVCEGVHRLARVSAFRKPATFHYLHLATSHAERLPDGEPVKLKTYFYGVRAALALRWLRIHERELPPMDIHALMSSAEPELRADILELVRLKSQRDEGGLGGRLPRVDALLASEIARAQDTASNLERPAPAPELVEAADGLLLDILHGRLLA